MNVRVLATGDFEANCYIVSDAGQALIIDPGDEADRIVLALRENRLTVVAYLVTHGHVDHISALACLARQFPAPVGIHPADARWAFAGSNKLLPWYDAPERPSQTARELADNQLWTDSGFNYQVLATPGHSPGCVCFYFQDEQVVFTGDTLFAGSVGRTDLPGGDERLLTGSLSRLAQLPNNTIVYPGHGPRTTIGQEKQTNPFLRF